MICDTCNKNEAIPNKYQCEQCSEIINIERIPKTTKQWAISTTSKPPLLYYCVKSETYDNHFYEVEYFKEINCFACDCPAWKYKKCVRHNLRTCKHIIAIRGEKNEQDRIHKNGGKWIYKPAKIYKTKINKKINKKILKFDI